MKLCSSRSGADGKGPLAKQRSVTHAIDDNAECLWSILSDPCGNASATLATRSLLLFGKRPRHSLRGTGGSVAPAPHVRVTDFHETATHMGFSSSQFEGASQLLNQGSLREVAHFALLFREIRARLHAGNLTSCIRSMDSGCRMMREAEVQTKVQLDEETDDAGSGSAGETDLQGGVLSGVSLKTTELKAEEGIQTKKCEEADFCRAAKKAPATPTSLIALSRGAASSLRADGQGVSTVRSCQHSIRKSGGGYTTVVSHVPSVL